MKQNTKKQFIECFGIKKFKNDTLLLKYTDKTYLFYIKNEG